MLDEHFRSRPEIIRFSNRTFYDDRLKIMTERPAIETNASLTFHPVKGQRNETGHNEQEATTLIRDIRDQIEHEDRLGEAVRHSIGVISPFRDQVDFIFSQLSEQLSTSDLERHRLRIGTPHEFQGEERDTMYVSLALDNDSHVGAFRFLERADVFNVLITRARVLQRVYYSVDPARAPHGGLLAAYLNQPSDHADRGDRNADDPFLVTVEQAFAERGYRTWKSYTLAGTQIDLIVEKSGSLLAIDLVGRPGPYADALDLERYRMLERAGLWVFPLAWSEWNADSDGCLSTIENWIAHDHSTTGRRANSQK